MKEFPSLLLKNMQTLEKIQPQLALRLRQYVDDIPSLREPVFEQTASGRWVAGLSEKPFFEKKAVLEKRAKAKPSAVYLVFGMGSAPYLFNVLRSLPREALSVIVIEPSFDLLLHTLSQTSVFQALPTGCRISFITGKDRVLMDEAFSWNVVPLGIFPVSKAIAITHEGEVEAVDFSEAESAFKKQVIYRLTMLGNSPEDTLLGLRHAALNTLRILNSSRLADLREAYQGKPFVCVASGPSLEKNVHLLNDIQDKCVIVACDTILFFLLERGIVPHVVTSIERPYITYTAWVPRVLEKHREKCKEILLLSQSVSYPLTAGRWPGPTIVVGKRDVPVDNWFAGAILGEQLLYSGLSVAHMALSLALTCDAPSVVLIGQDLAFSEEGVSHATDAVSEEILALDQMLLKDTVTVPGALKETVETCTIWLTFIQIFERLLAAYPGTPVFDCTEGGALIEGTEVTPFLEYINENIVTSNYSVSRWETPSSEKKIDEELLNRFEKAFAELDGLNRRLNDMREGITRCTAPALTPERRQSLAFSVAVILDEIHAMNPVISFIGQSYTHLSGTVLSENRFLENVEQVERWKKLHEEIMDSHFYAVEFIRQWLDYAKGLVKGTIEGCFVDARMLPNNGEEMFLEFFDPRKLVEVDTMDFVQLVDILSCKDPLGEGWSPDALWKAALVLFGQGRAEEARGFMSKAYELMEGKEVSTETIGVFFKDWGKMAAADDLCVFPLFIDAMTYLANAREYLPEDEDIPLLQESIMKRQEQHVIGIGKAIGSKSEEVALFLLRSEAETALLKKDLPSALRAVEKLVWESMENYPSSAVAHLQWLLKTALDCVDASDQMIANLSSEILERILSRLPRLIEKKINFPVEFFSYLEKMGIKFSVQSSDNNNKSE